MTLFDILQFAKDYPIVQFAWLVPLYVILKLIDVSKIKLNPWTKIRNGITQFFIGNTTETIERLENKIDNVENKLDGHIKESAEKDVEDMRNAIVDFASAIGEKKRNYTKEQYEQMIRLTDKYKAICDKHGIDNGVAEESTALIRNMYRMRLADNSFLQGIYYLTPKENEND